MSQKVTSQSIPTTGQFTGFSMKGTLSSFGLILTDSISRRPEKETLAQVFSSEFCEIFKNTYFYRTPLVAASEIQV